MSLCLDTAIIPLMAVWQYADWLNRSTYPTDQARYDRLALHIQEVSEHVMGVESQQGADRRRKDAVIQAYLQYLLDEQARLDRALAVQRVGRPARTHARWG